MNRLSILLAGVLACLATEVSAEKLVKYVNPLVGTAGFGNVYPGAQIPFGGIQISPDTDESDYDTASGYKYTKPTIMGFSLTHLSGTGIPDLGDFLFVPGTGTVKSAAGDAEDPDSGYRSRFRHETESATPGYYCVNLDDYGTRAEMTAAARSGVLRFTFPASDSSFVMVDLNHTLQFKCVWSSVRQLDEYTIVGSKTVNGWNPDRHVHFAARFSRPIKDFLILKQGKPVIYDTSRFRSSLEAWGTGLQACGRTSTPSAARPRPCGRRNSPVMSWIRPAVRMPRRPSTRAFTTPPCILSCSRTSTDASGRMTAPSARPKGSRTIRPSPCGTPTAPSIPC